MIDGWVTENVKICQLISKLYKQLSLRETDHTRLMALIQRRIDLIEPLRKLLNPNSYYTLITEMAAELADIYS